MNNKSGHSTIKRYNERKVSAESNVRYSKLNAVQLREMYLELADDDVGFVTFEIVFLPSIYTSFCVRRSSFWVNTKSSGQAIFVSSKCN